MPGTFNLLNIDCGKADLDTERASCCRWDRGWLETRFHLRRKIITGEFSVLLTDHGLKEVPPYKVLVTVKYLWSCVP